MRTWVTVYECDRCGQHSLHVEVSPVADDPDGLPFWQRLCECGGFLRLADFALKENDPSDFAA